MLYCCGSTRNTTVKLLKDSEEYYNRRIEYGYCPLCSKFLAKEIKTSFESDKVIIDSAKGRKAKKIVDRCKKDIIAIDLCNVKNGSKSNTHYKYGVNRYIYGRNKKIIGYETWAEDLNGQKDHTSIKEYKYKQTDND